MDTTGSFDGIDQFVQFVSKFQMRFFVPIESDTTGLDRHQGSPGPYSVNDLEHSNVVVKFVVPIPHILVSFDWKSVFQRGPSCSPRSG